MLNKDSFVFGFIMGTGLPVVFFGILFLINLMVEKLMVHRNFIALNSLILVSIALNLIVLRYYFVRLRFDKTGRGILLITFAYILLFFVFIDQSKF